MKVCPKCNRACEEETNFCTVCGTRLDERSKSQSFSRLTGRSITVAVLLTLLTCGIYGLYWLVKLNNEMNELSADREGASGELVLLLVLVTCGIYGYFWIYQMGKKYDRISGKNGSGELCFLVLYIFGCGIIPFILMQHLVNREAGYSGTL